MTDIMAILQTNGLLAIVMSIVKMALSYFEKKVTEDRQFQPTKAGKSVATDTLVGTAAGTLISVATGIPGLGEAVSIGITPMGDKIVTTVKTSATTMTKTVEQKNKDIFNWLFNNWFYVDHENTSASLELVKKGVIKPLGYPLVKDGINIGIAGSVNAISKKRAAYIPDSSLAIQSTWQDARKLYKEKQSIEVIKSFFYEALSYQVGPYKATINAIENAGSRQDNIRMATVKELMRQIVWNDPRVIDKMCKELGINDSDIQQFLLYLANDDLSIDEGT